MSQESAVRALSETDPTLPILGAVVEERTRPQRITKAPDTPHPPVQEAYPDSSLQAFSKLNEAAQRIAQDDAASNRRLPRASRLAPFRDISAEIRRESTPLPKYSKMHPGRNPQEFEVPGAEENGHNELSPRESGEQAIEDTSWPDFWPWFDADSEEKEGEDAWANRTDPLITRHRPNSVEAAIIEQEDIRRALAEGIPTSQLPVRVLPRKKSPLRNIFIALAIFAVVALLIDGVLLAVLSGHSHSPASARSNLSAVSLTLTTNLVDFATETSAQQTVQINLLNFAHHAHVLLTHDTQDPVHTPGGSSVVQVNAHGAVTVEMVVTPDWGPGIHYIFAEDLTTHNTASASLRVQIGGEQSQPPHLEISATALDLKTGLPGTISDQAIQLKNSSLSGSITWSASSNQAWLLISPSSGTFDHSQTIVVAVQRPISNKQSNYSGAITFDSNAGKQIVKVKMNVSSLALTSAVLALSPAVLSFTTTDGSSAPPAQLLSINNPGSKSLTWSLAIYAQTTASTQIVLARQSGASGSWLVATQTSGTIPALSNARINISVQTAGLLPGAYLGSLVFAAQDAVDTSQSVSVSLTVLPRCGLLSTTGFLSFTAVQGKASAGSQAVGLSETASCAGSLLPWAAQVSTPSWLSVTPTSGQLHGMTSQFLTVSVNSAALAPQSQPYVGFLVFTTQKSTQTVLVQLLVQQPPPASSPEPIMGASPLNLNFSSTQGQPNPSGQVVTITNNGTGTLFWKATPTLFGCSWLGVSPTGGNVPKGQTGEVTINVITSCLSPGTYAGQVTLEGTDSAGKPASGSGPNGLAVQVNLVVQPACTLTQPSSQALSFSGVQGGSNPILQNVLVTGTGNCTWPLLVSATSSASWLQVPSNVASIRGNGQSTSVAIGPSNGYPSLNAGTYTAQITITATDSAGIVAQGSGQTITVTLTVQSPPCTIATPSPSSLSFTLTQGATSGTTQPVALSAISGCAYYPLTYTASTSAAWLTLTKPSADTGSGSMLGVNVSATGLPPGTLQGQITVTATDKNGAPVLNPLTITVTLTVLPTISGTVYACTGAPPCVASVPLAGATITVLDGSGATVATVTADSSGNYVISSVPIGNYTVNVNGTLSLVQYTATGVVLQITGNATGVNFYAYAG